MNASFKDRLRSLFSNDFFVAALFLIAYLCTNSYIYGFDDQHLEIPTLKHLIDPSLYKGDYYVESLAKNFSSYLYPILARFITTAQVPATYWVLFLFARYMMFFWVYKLWQLVSKEKLAAACATLMFFLLGRTEEFLYRTFSHQELAEGFMFAGIYFFFKERYVLAALIFGFAANFHAIYNLFPMCFMLVFLVLFHPERFKMAFKAGLTFTIACLPFLLWQIPRSMADKLSGAAAVPVKDWMPLYLQSCPQNFLFFEVPFQEALQHFSYALERLEPYLFVTVMYIFLLVFDPAFRKEKKMHVIFAVGFAFIIFSTIFSYLIPSRFVLDLNLLRNEQYIRFFLMGYITLWALKTVKDVKPWLAFAAGLIFLYAGFGKTEYFAIKTQKFAWVLAAMTLVFLALQFKLLQKWEVHLRKALIILPLLGGFISFCLFHYRYLEIRDHGSGFWQLQRNWIDMQHYVHDHTPKDAMIMAPIDTDMGGFRITSERKVVVCTRDCGIIGFDYKASVEWRKRMDDLNDFRVMVDHPVDKAILAGIFKYKVDYIVFMKYYAPRSDNPALKKLYENEVFSLFKVMVHP